MLIIPLGFAIGLAPVQRLNTSRKAIGLAAIVLSWPLATLALMLFEGQNGPDVMAVFAATIVGSATAYATAPLLSRSNTPTQKSLESPGKFTMRNSWAISWRAILIWICLTPTLGASAGISAALLGVPEFARFAGEVVGSLCIPVSAVIAYLSVRRASGLVSS